MAGNTGAIRAGRAFIEVLLDGSKVEAGLKVTAAKLKAFGATIGDIGKKMSLLSGAALAPLAAAAKMFGSMGEQMSTMSARTGVSVENLSTLAFAASQAGVDMETLEGSLRKMQKAIVEAAGGSGKAVEVLDRLGLSVGQLAGLSPDKQFALIGDRLSRIADPTIRAATAMAIFGRSGTAVLPMLAGGAEGLERFQAQARLLGLTIGTEDAEAGHRFNNILSTLWQVVQRGIYSVGAALVPTLSAAAKWLGAATIAATNWVKANGPMIATAMKVAAGVGAAGLALVAVGKAVSITGTAIGGIMAVVHGVGAAVTMLGTVIAGVLSPFGILLAAAAALGGYLVQSSGIGGKAVSWLGDRFGEIRDDAVASFQGISDALAAGDIALAGRIVWATLKMEWTKGTGAISRIWQDSLLWMREQFATIWYGFKAVFSIVGHGLSVAWIETTSFLSKTWAQFTSAVATAWEWCSKILTKAWNEIKGLFDSKFDVSAANAAADVMYEAAKERIEQEKNAKLTALEAERKAKRDQETAEHNQAMKTISDEDAAYRSAAQKLHDEAVKNSEDEVAKARKEWEDARKEAAGKRQEKEARGEMPTLEPHQDLLAKAKAQLNLGLDDLAMAHSQAAGTFSAAGAFGFGGAGGTMEAIRDNTKRGADAEEKTARWVQEMSQKTTGPEFTP